jgi:polyhydroxyalkanoate synthesis repressor PhaR
LSTGFCAPQHDYRFSVAGSDGYNCGKSIILTRFRDVDFSRKEPTMADTSESVRLIKKYPNRRLYDTATSSYITLADVKRLVLDNMEFRVVDARSNDDLTRSILLQIILEEESGGMPMFSSDMLSHIIRFYGNAMQGLMGNYLEKNIQTFMDLQNRLQDQSRALYAQNPMLSADAWSQFMKMQGPTIQNFMSSYLEQSAKMFLEMQAQLQRQTRNLFGSFSFPGLGANRESEEKVRTDDAEGSAKS